MEGDREDPDRAAILARRNRLIGLALSSLTLTSACDASDGSRQSVETTEIAQKELGAKPSPMPCLTPVLRDPMAPLAPTPVPPPTGAPTGEPQVCLSVAAPEEDLPAHTVEDED